MGTSRGTKRALLLGLITLSLLAGCKAGAAPNAGFIQHPEWMVKPKLLPFHGAWAKPNLAWDDYTEILIAPVDTQHLLDSEWWQKRFFHDRQKDSERVAKELHERLEKAFAEDENHRYTVVQEAGSKTLIFELAIVELIPTSVTGNLVGYGASILIPGGGLIRTFTKGSMAYEARLRDSATQEVVVTFKDREWMKFSIFNVDDFSYFRFADEIMDEWCQQFVSIANLGMDTRVKDSKAYKLRPW
ncbi:MAG: DUF3313 family protein [Planctomycetota bacterium]